MRLQAILQKLGSAWGTIIIAIYMLITLAPLYWLFVTALKPDWAIFSDPPYLVPPEITWDHIVATVRGTAQLKSALGFMRDSLVVAAGNALLSTVVGVLAAYSVARFRTGGQHFSFWILSQRFMPPIVFIIPLFVIFRALHLVDTYLGLILVYCTFNIPFAVWLMIGFIEQSPEELEDAAMVDGCSRLGALVRITLPVIAPGLVVTVLFTFLFAWNEYIFALLLASNRVATLPVYLPRLRGSHDILYGEIAAASIFAVFPAIVLAFLLQRYLVRGLTLGAIK